MDVTNQYLAKETVSAATRIESYVCKTPTQKSVYLSQITGACVYLKMESHQITGSFKVRGAFNKVLKCHENQPEAIKEKKFYTASSGNHGLAMTLALHTLGRKAVVFVTENCSDAKLKSLSLYGAEVRKIGNDCAITESESRNAAEKDGAVYVSPYNDVDVMAGQGTIAFEILQDCKHVDAVFVTVGGGGLVSGVSAYLKHQNSKIQVIGCSPTNSNCMEQSVKAEKQIDIINKETLSDGSAGNIEIPSATFSVCQRNIDRWVNVTEEEISDALFLMMDVHHQIVEGAAACALASFLKVSNDFKGKNVAIILCGCNIPTTTIKTIIDSHIH